MSECAAPAWTGIHNVVRGERIAYCGLAGARVANDYVVRGLPPKHRTIAQITGDDR